MANADEGESFFTDVDTNEPETFEGGLADYEDEGSYSDGLSDEEFAQELAEVKLFKLVFSKHVNKRISMQL
jgi:hypothetical protein